MGQLGVIPFETKSLVGYHIRLGKRPNSKLDELLLSRIFVLIRITSRHLDIRSKALLGSAYAQLAISRVSA